MEKTNKKKILSAVSFFLSAIIFIFALSVFIVTLTARAEGRPAFIFGYSMAIVATGSMTPEINVGDLVFIKSCDISEMEEGQNAVFIGLHDDYKDKCIVHKVIERIAADDGNGNQTVSLRTMGIYNGVADDDLVTAENFLGMEVYHSAALGSVMLFLQNPINWVYIIVILVATAIVISQIKRIVKAARKGPPPESEEGAEQPLTAENSHINAESHEEADTQASAENFEETDTHINAENFEEAAEQTTEPEQKTK